MGDDATRASWRSGPVDLTALVAEGRNITKILLFWTAVAAPALVVRVALNPPPPLGLFVSGWVALAYGVGLGTLVVYLLARGVALGRPDDAGARVERSTE